MPITAAELVPAIALWDDLAGASARLINHSENQTFLLEASSGEFVLRVHRSGYQSRPSIESELAWLTALRRDTALPVPEPVAGRDGRLLQGFASGKGERLAVLFRRLPGVEPTLEDDLSSLFQTLGAYAATMHEHVAGWKRPVGFKRQVWEASTILDPDGLWGDWRQAPNVDEERRLVLVRLDQTLRARLADYGTAPGRFGLIHADMRLGNVLLDGERSYLLDFDDCGFCWFAYDFAAAISFHETHAAIPQLRDAWFGGYRTVRSLSQEDLDITDTMVMLRRMALLAWIGSHGETRLAQHHAPGFAEGTAALAERYLAGPLWP